MLVALLMKADVDAKHCQGYLAFVSYCFLSAVSMWLLDESEGGSSKPLSIFSSTASGVFGGKGPSQGVLGGSLLVFLLLLGCGAAVFPLGALRVTEEAVRRSQALQAKIQENSGALALLGEGAGATLLAGFAERVPKPEAEASVIQAVAVLLGSRHVYTIVGSVILFIGVLLLPVVEACTATVMSMRLSNSSQGQSQANQEQTDVKQMRTALDMVSDLAMLDVFVIGVLISSLILGTIEVLDSELLGGFYVLLAAAAMGVFHRALCGAAIDGGGPS